mmetsp:Transcript_6464/g.18799  ORF Transcript_6464/g.18799 Transcript_6464/m.18799 type:complete len:227 (-) Transcript_6464:1222-1902(-)
MAVSQRDALALVAVWQATPFHLGGPARASCGILCDASLPKLTTPDENAALVRCGGRVGVGRGRVGHGVPLDGVHALGLVALQLIMSERPAIRVSPRVNLPARRDRRRAVSGSGHLGYGMWHLDAPRGTYAAAERIVGLTYPEEVAVGYIAANLVPKSEQLPGGGDHTAMERACRELAHGNARELGPAAQGVRRLVAPAPAGLHRGGALPEHACTQFHALAVAGEEP